MHLKYKKYIQRKCGNTEVDYMGRNYRFNEYINEYDTQLSTKEFLWIFSEIHQEYEEYI